MVLHQLLLTLSLLPQYDIDLTTDGVHNMNMFPFNQDYTTDPVPLMPLPTLNDGDKLLLHFDFGDKGIKLNDSK